MMNLPIREVSSVAWLRNFLRRRNLVGPDTRALFKYKVTKAELEELRAHVRRRLPSGTHDGAMFCLYAAEWWRRYGSGFRWDGLLESVDLEVPYTSLYPAIEAGLARYWGRPVRIGRTSTGVKRHWRDFVGTLSREGGLPLQMLLGAQTSVRRFFRRLLEDRYASGVMSPETAEAAANILPPAWRHPDIYELAADLVTKLWQLRDLVKDSDRPVEALDQRLPGWKETLPVLVDSDIAVVLVRGLVEDAHRVADAGRPAIVVETTLIREGERWRIERTVGLPREIRQARMVVLFGLSNADDVERRIRLSLDDGGRVRAFADATQWEASPIYALEHLAESPLVLESLGDVSIVGQTGREVHHGKVLHGGEALDDAPWIFASPSADNTVEEWTFVAQGSRRVRAAPVMVAVPEHCVVEAQEGADSAECGVLQTGHGPRRLLRLEAGTIRLLDKRGGDRYRIEVKATDEDLSAFRLEGAALEEEDSRRVWRGVPKLVALGASGARREIAVRAIEWRPRGARHAWAPISPACVGQVEIRYAPEGDTFFRKTVRIVPAETAIDLMRSDRPGEGGFYLRGTGAKRAELVASDQFSAVCDREGESFVWMLEANEEAPATIDVDLIWDAARSLRLRLPFPALGVRVRDRAARPLAAGSTVALENLPGCRVEAIVPLTEPTPVLVGRLRDAAIRFAGDCEVSWALRDKSPRGSSRMRRYVLDLQEIAEDLRIRLASSAEMNAYVELFVNTRSAGKVAIKVRRFPVSMRVGPNGDQVVVLLDKSEAHVGDLLARMQLSRLPIEDPRAAPELLERIDESAWLLDEGDGGPRTWLILGHDGERCCARPVIWTPPMVEEAGADEADEMVGMMPQVRTLDAAVRVGPRNRKAAIKDLLRRMCETDGHPEWRYLLPYVETLAHLPATTFDILDAMAHVPRACVYALLGAASKVSFRVLWSGFEDLSFFWETVAVRDWIAGVRLWWQSAHEQLAEVEDEHRRDLATESLFSTYRSTMAQIGLRTKSFSIVQELCDEHVFGIKAEGPCLTTALRDPEGRKRLHLQERRDGALMELMREHPATDVPMMDATRVLKNYLAELLPPQLMALERFDRTIDASYLSVALAPVLAALCAAWGGVRLRDEQIFALRQLKAFDTTWFQRCYDDTFAAAVGVVLQDHPERYR